MLEMILWVALALIALWYVTSEYKTGRSRKARGKGETEIRVINLTGKPVEIKDLITNRGRIYDTVVPPDGGGSPKILTSCNGVLPIQKISVGWPGQIVTTSESTKSNPPVMFHKSTDCPLLVMVYAYEDQSGQVAILVTSLVGMIMSTLWCSETGGIYIVSEHLRKFQLSSYEYERLGRPPLTSVPCSFLKAIPDGEGSYTHEQDYPSGLYEHQTVRCSKTGNIYLLHGGFKLHFSSFEIYQAFGSPAYREVDCTILESIPSGRDII